MKKPKRFIAGAICPCCKEMDKLVIWFEESLPHRECIACGFTDMLDEAKEKLNSPLEPSRQIQSQNQLQQKTKTIQFFPVQSSKNKIH